MKLALGDPTNHFVNAILSLLCKLHFPDLVQFGVVYEPAYMWDHYIVANASDWDGRVFANKAKGVKDEMWVSIPCTK